MKKCAFLFAVASVLLLVGLVGASDRASEDESEVIDNVVPDMRRTASFRLPKAKYDPRNDDQRRDDWENSQPISISGIPRPKKPVKNPFAEPEGVPTENASKKVDVDSYESALKLKNLGALDKEALKSYATSASVGAYVTSEVALLNRLRSVDFWLFENSVTPNYDIAKDVGMGVISVGMGTLSFLGSLGVHMQSLIGISYHDFKNLKEVISTQELFDTIMSTAHSYLAYVEGRTTSIVETGGRAPMLLFPETSMGTLWGAYEDVAKTARSTEEDKANMLKWVAEESERLASEATSAAAIAACKTSSFMSSLGVKIGRGIAHIGMGIVDCATMGLTLPVHVGIGVAEASTATGTGVAARVMQNKKLKMFLWGLYELERGIRGELWKREAVATGDDEMDAIPFRFCDITHHDLPNFGCDEGYFCQRLFLFFPENREKFYHAEDDPRGYCAPRKSKVRLAKGDPCLDHSDCASSFCHFDSLKLLEAYKELRPHNLGHQRDETGRRQTAKKVSAFLGVAPPDVDEPGSDKVPDWTNDRYSRWVKVGLEMPRWKEDAFLPRGAAKTLLKGKCASAIPASVDCGDECYGDMPESIKYQVLKHDSAQHDSIVSGVRATIEKERRLQESALGVDNPSRAAVVKSFDDEEVDEPGY